MGAQCGACGGQVMPYRRYFFYNRPTAVCDGCGKKVELRGWKALIVVLVVFVGLIAGAIFVSDSVGMFAIITISLVVLGILTDVWTFLKLPWDPIEDAGTTT